MSDTTTDKPTMELTRNPVDGTWGFICLEHGVHRSGLAERHALNVEAKHIREDHADPEGIVADLAPLARRAAEEYAAQHLSTFVALWEETTGLSREAAKALALGTAMTGQPLRAAVVPF